MQDGLFPEPEPDSEGPAGPAASEQGTRLHGFDTDSVVAATAALLVYAVYRSRDHARYKVRPDMWGQIERFTKAAAKRASTLGQFLDALKPRLCCESVRPRWLRADGAPEGLPGDWLPRVREDDARAVLRLLYRETAWIILLVRDRLERERALAAITPPAPDVKAEPDVESESDVETEAEIGEEE